MEREKIINIGPVCRFGPGGEFTSNWPFYAGAAKGRHVNDNDMLFTEEEQKSVLKKLGNMLIGIIEALRGDAEYEIEGPMEISESYEQGVTSYVTKDQGTAYAETGAGVKHNNGIPRQSWLFADDWRAGGAAGNKQNHGVRAHRAVAKKRAYFGNNGQSSLFDADLEDAKTA